MARREAGIRVLIVDDHRLFAEAIKPALIDQGVEVLPVAGTGHDALELARSRRPDLVLMDIGLPDRSGLQVGKDLLEEMPEVRVVALTAIEDGKLADEAIRVGFHGYVTKGSDMNQFVHSLRSVMAGNVVVPRQLSRSHRTMRDAAFDHLTARELEVLELLAQGTPSEGIAEALGIARNTVRTHVQSILTKLQVHSRLEAAAYAVQNGLIEVHPGSHASAASG